jgi:predicted ester cyclase
MSVEANKATFQRFFEEVANKGHLAIIDELFDANAIYHLPGSEPLHGPEGVKGVVTAFRTAFPDLHVKIEQLIGEGDTIVARVSPSGTNTGELMGQAPTGKQATWSVVHVCRFADGRIAEDRITFDQLSFLQQLGLAAVH